MVTGRPVRLARAWAVVPGFSGTQLSMSMVDSSWVCRAPVKSGFDQRQSCPLAQAPRDTGAASAGAVVPVGASRNRAVTARKAAATVVRM